MSNFKIGQKVVLINDNFDHYNYFVSKGHKFPIKNEIYTIRGFGWNGGILLEEIVNPTMFYLSVMGNYELSFNETRFRPLDHAFADEVEAMIKEKVRQEELQSV